MHVTITEQAQKVLDSQFNNVENKYLRIFIQGFGWAGPRFGITLDEVKDTNKDYSESVDKFNVLVEKDLISQYKNFKIDYSDSWMNKGFNVVPGAGGSSSC